MFKRRVSLVTSIALTIALLSSTAAVSAQASANDWSRVTALESGSKVAVKLKDGKSVEGRIDSASDSSLTLKVKSTNRELKREDVATVHHLTKRSATKATLIGAGVGAGAGALVGAAGATNDFDKLDQAVTAGLAIIGAGMGAVGGYLIGRSGRKRELIYQAR